MPAKNNPQAPLEPAAVDPAVAVGERLEHFLDALMLSNDPVRRAGAAMWRKFVKGRIARLKRPRRARRPRLAKVA